MSKEGCDSMLNVSLDTGEGICDCNILVPIYRDKPYALHQIGSLKIELAREELKTLQRLSHKKINRFSEPRANTLKTLKRAINEAEQGGKVFNMAQDNGISISDLGGKARFKFRLIEFNPGYRIIRLVNVDTIEYIVICMLELVLEKEEFKMLENKINEIRRTKGKFVTRKQAIVRLLDHSMKDCVEASIVIKALMEIHGQIQFMGEEGFKEDSSCIFQRLYSALKRALIEEIAKQKFEVGEVVCIISNRAIIYDLTNYILSNQNTNFINVAIGERMFKIKYEIL